MGLDMYLHKRTYVGNKYRSNNEKIQVIVPNEQKEAIFPIKEINDNRISSIEEEVAYWRKSNQIHNWFVQNIQDGNDDCGDYYVSKESLKELIDLCKEVLADKSKAETLLPSSAGFFFGSTEYDEWYFKDLTKTIDMLEPLLEESGDFYYHSSW